MEGGLPSLGWVSVGAISVLEIIFITVQGYFKIGNNLLLMQKMGAAAVHSALQEPATMAGPDLVRKIFHFIHWTQPC